MPLEGSRWKQIAAFFFFFFFFFFSFFFFFFFKEIHVLLFIYL